MKRGFITLWGMVLILLFAGLWAPCAAQRLTAIKAELAQPVTDTLSLRTATVTVSEEAPAAEALTRIGTPSKSAKFQGWRVCIFSDNTAEARSKAQQAKDSFLEHFAGIPVYSEYVSPYFRVSVGNCTTTEEAIILLNRVNKLFPKAFVKQEQLTLENLLE